MNQEVAALIDECVRLQNELSLLTPVMLILDPSRNPNRSATDQVTSLNQRKFKEKWKQLGGWERIKGEYFRQERELSHKLSDLAELLEEEGFDVERFRFGLSRDQFFWLHSEKGTIKKHLRGVAIRAFTRR
jgi:hypothetical protein